MRCPVRTLRQPQRQDGRRCDSRASHLRRSGVACECGGRDKGKVRHTAKDGCSSSSPEMQKNETVLLCTVTQCSAALHPHITLNNCRVKIPGKLTQCTAKLKKKNTVRSSSDSSSNTYSSGCSLQHGGGAATSDYRCSSLNNFRDVVAQHQRLFVPATPPKSNGAIGSNPRYCLSPPLPTND